jgi:isopentenyl-diphosphate delta-isomerase
LFKPKIKIMAKSHTHFTDQDATASSRKKDHIELAFKSQLAQMQIDTRFDYEPILAAHPNDTPQPFRFLNKTCLAPLWVSSMTGGTALARTINHNLAQAAREFGFGMGLGSCRSLLTDDEFLPDFDVRPILGDDLPLYANLGIAQLEKLIFSQQTHLIPNLIDKLQADGLIIHVNPLQEWLQPEGDRFRQSPLQTIEFLLEKFPNIPFIVKEVGQGMGRASLRALLQLPLAAIDFAANGGTNFAKIELSRSAEMEQKAYEPLAAVGHSATEMVTICNELISELGDKVLCNQIIVSGGIQHFLDGYYLINKLKMPAIYGQASAFLRYARGEYSDLQRFISTQVKGLQIAKAFLQVR